MSVTKLEIFLTLLGCCSPVILMLTLCTPMLAPVLFRLLSRSTVLLTYSTMGLAAMEVEISCTPSPADRVSWAGILSWKYPLELISSAKLNTTV